jgi:ribosomal protein S18 acetylase RimI-like enzyme
MKPTSLEARDERVRWSVPSDRPAILAAIEATGLFRANEIDVALEVLDDALAHGEPGHYQSYTAVLGEQPVGWVCFGPTPGTEGTFDLYWIVVTPERQRLGIGRVLIRHAEDLMAARGARLVVVETSGLAVYDPTRKFYLSMGYREGARLADFYAPGDDKVTYVKRTSINPRTN